MVDSFNFTTWSNFSCIHLARVCTTFQAVQKVKSLKLAFISTMISFIGNVLMLANRKSWKVGVSDKYGLNFIGLLSPTKLNNRALSWQRSNFFLGKYGRSYFIFWLMWHIWVLFNISPQYLSRKPEANVKTNLHNNGILESGNQKRSYFLPGGQIGIKLHPTYFYTHWKDTLQLLSDTRSFFFLAADEYYFVSIRQIYIYRFSIKMY